MKRIRGFGRKFYLVFGLLTLLGTVYLYIIINDAISKNQANQVSKSTKLPYVLTVEQVYKDYKFSSAIISVSTLSQTPTADKELIVVFPKGRIVPVSLETKNNYTFPSEFADPKAPIEQGVYDAILYNPSNNSNITSVKFSVAPTDVLNSLSISIFGQTVLSLIATLSIPLLWLFKTLHKLYSDRKRRIEEELLEAEKKRQEALDKSRARIEKKLNWTHENMKYYLAISQSSYQICDKIAKLFQSQVELVTKVDFDTNLLCNNKERKIREEAQGLLNWIINLLNSYNDFKKSLGYYYFDNIRAEAYANKIIDNVLTQSYNIFSDTTKFARYISRYKKRTEVNTDLEADLKSDFNEFQENLIDWICQKRDHSCSKYDSNCCRNNIECYYKNNLTIFYLLDICINNILSISYSKERSKKDLYSEIEKYKIQTKSHILNTMPLFLQDETVNSTKMWKQIFE